MALTTLIGSVALLVAVVSVSTGGPSKASQSEGSAVSGSSTATVQRRDLVQTDTETGTIGHTDTRDVYNHLSGTVTWVPKAGAVIKDDRALYRVDGRVVYLLYGTIPAYRSFSSGMVTADEAKSYRGTCVDSELCTRVLPSAVSRVSRRVGSGRLELVFCLFADSDRLDRRGV